MEDCILLALASGKRRSELHAMRKDILHSKGWGSITIMPDPGFISKTELANKGSDLINVVTIKALTKDLSPDMQEDRSLCAVRAVRYYLEQTKDVRGERKKLFITYKKGHEKEVHMNTISSWLKKTIHFAYDSSKEEDQRVTGVKGHQVRSMAASWALYNKASMQDIMNACSWKNPSTFTRFYLKDLALEREKMYHLGPVISASHSSQ